MRQNITDSVAELALERHGPLDNGLRTHAGPWEEACLGERWPAAGAALARLRQLRSGTRGRGQGEHLRQLVETVRPHRHGLALAGTDRDPGFMYQLPLTSIPAGIDIQGISPIRAVVTAVEDDHHGSHQGLREHHLDPGPILQRSME